MPHSPSVASTVDGGVVSPIMPGLPEPAMGLSPQPFSADTQ